MAIELVNGIVDEEPSNYEEDDFEVEEQAPQKEIKEAVILEKV